MTNKYRLVLEASRNVRVPSGGADCYTCDWKKIEVPVGRKYQFKTRKKAHTYLKVLANILANKSTSVAIVHWTGYSGQTIFIKQSEQMFDTNWEGVPITI